MANVSTTLKVLLAPFLATATVRSQQHVVDVHFPNLSVGETLTFAALARTPHTRIPGISREQWAGHMRDVIMAVFGISHTYNTKVGNDFIRGVSGGCVVSPHTPQDPF